jgi:glycosyltransferase involved in cell wall biosynthesis
LIKRQSAMAEPRHPLISILVPCYNTERYIRNCLESIRLQSINDFEVLLLDDCSTDGTILIAREYEARDARFHLHSTSENSGIAAVRNLGLDRARGEFITSLDGDDVYLSKNKLAAEYDVLCKHATAGGVDVAAFSNVDRIDTAGRFLSCVGDEKEVVEGEIYHRVLARDCFIPRDYLCHRRVYEKTGRFNEDLEIYEDWDYKIRIAAKFSFYYSGITGIGYRQHATGLSSASRLTHIRVMRKIRRSYEANREGLGTALRHLWNRTKV